MTTKSLKASSGRPLPMHVSQHGRIPWHTLHPKPRSRVMSDLCLLWTPCALVLVSWCIYAAVLTIPACSLQDPTPFQSGLHLPPPPTSSPAEGIFVMVPFVIFFLHLTGAPQHRPSFLHGGLVSNYFLASGDFLICVAGVRKDFCLCHGRRNLALMCSSGPTPNPCPISSGGQELSAAVWSLPPSSRSPLPSLPQKPSSLLAPSPGLPAQGPLQTRHQHHPECHSSCPAANHMSVVLRCGPIS